MVTVQAEITVRPRPPSPPTAFGTQAMVRTGPLRNPWASRSSTPGFVCEVLTVHSDNTVMLPSRAIAAGMQLTVSTGPL